jgi:hypothetical protein
MDFIIIALVVVGLGFLAIRFRGVVSLVAGAALFLFIWAMVLSVLGRNDFVSLLFIVTALALITRQYRRRRGVT